MARPLSLIGSLAAFALVASELDAQQRGSFWIALGVSPGSGSCTQVNPRVDPPLHRCSTERKLGFSGLVSAGGTVAEGVRLGLEANGWTHSNPDTVRQYGVVTAVVLVHPSPRLPYYLKGGLGVGRYAEDHGSEVLTASGFALAVGGGVDLWTTGPVALAPFIQYVIADNLPASLGRLNDLQDPLDFNLLQLGVGVRWR